MALEQSKHIPPAVVVSTSSSPSVRTHSVSVHGPTLSAVPCAVLLTSLRAQLGGVSGSPRSAPMQVCASMYGSLASGQSV